MTTTATKSGWKKTTTKKSDDDHHIFIWMVLLMLLFTYFLSFLVHFHSNPLLYSVLLFCMRIFEDACKFSAYQNINSYITRYNLVAPNNSESQRKKERSVLFMPSTTLTHPRQRAFLLGESEFACSSIKETKK